jgi:transcriptional regulator with XRE-family HTH domain
MSPAEFQEARTRMGLDLRGVAALLGVSRRQVIRYERGPGEIPEPVARLLWLMESERITPERFCQIFQITLAA